MKAVRSLVFLIFVSTVLATEITTPQTGSPERKAILDAIRVPLSELAGHKVLFLHPLIRISDGWALVQSHLELDGGGGLPKQFQSGCVGVAQEVKGKWELRSWGFASDGNALVRFRKQYPNAPAVLFNEQQTATAAGFHLDEQGIPVVPAGPTPNEQIDYEAAARPRKITSWPKEGQGPATFYIWKARVWSKRIVGDGTVSIEFIPESNDFEEIEDSGRISRANREKIERLKIQLTLPANKAAFFVPCSIDYDASEVCSIGLNQRGEIAYIKFWYDKDGYEVSGGNLILRCRAYHGGGEGPLLAKASFTPSDLENMKADGAIDEEIVKAAKNAAKQLRNRSEPFPNYVRLKAEKDNRLRMANPQDRESIELGSFSGDHLIFGGEPALYVVLLANGGVTCELSLGENGDGGEDWLEPLDIPVSATARPKPVPKADNPAPSKGDAKP